MTELENSLKDLKLEIEKHSQRQLKAQMQADLATKELTAALETLKTDYGISSLEEARAELIRLKKTLEDLLHEAEKKLGEIV